MDRIERIRQSFIPKRVEESDTHDPIRRHDPDYHKHKDKHADHTKSQEEDMTDISVESLITYLHGLKRDDTNNPDTLPKSTDPSMKKAISAYTHDEQKSRQRYTYLDDQSQIVDPERIDKMIQSLQALLDSGTDHITLIPEKGFLDSIEKTVEKYSGL
tara:strand:- start:196 stop:669 length:474 start_codon:yes stop_codon:yes gene_type:complete